MNMLQDSFCQLFIIVLPTIGRDLASNTKMSCVVSVASLLQDLSILLKV